MQRFLTRSLRPTFRALATSFVPELMDAGAFEWVGLEETVERALAARPPRLGRQLSAFVRLLDWSARLRYGRTLTQLSPAKRTALLEAFATGPVLLFRRGVWGLRTMVLMGWYTQPAVIARLGYRADPAGWGAPR